MLQRIGHRIALQFTALVFLLLLINGVLFLAADLGNTQRQAHFVLDRTARLIADRGSTALAFPENLPPMIRERMRILDADGNVVFGGAMFVGVPFDGQLGFDEATVGTDEFDVLTQPIIGDGGVIGFLQVAERQHGAWRDLPARGLLYFLVSIAVSALIYIVGVSFARRSLRPAEEMMVRLEQFTQDASHELRTPLAALSSSLDLALRTKKYREGIESAKQDLRQVIGLVERLLELTRLDAALVLEKADLSAVVGQAVEHMRPLASESGVALTASIAANITAKADPALVRQMIVNLISNAIKFRRGKQPTVTVTLTPSAILVADNGIGIASGDLPNLFNRFYQVDPSRSGGGFGLGLALVQRIVHLHGWSIDVESKPNVGTTFKVGIARTRERANVA